MPAGSSPVARSQHLIELLRNGYEAWV